MPPLVTLRGFTAADPLDRVPDAIRTVVVMLVTALIGFLFFTIESAHFLNIVQYAGDWVILMAVAIFTLIVAPLQTLLRKSASLVLFLMIWIPTVLLDIYLEANVREAGNTAIWMYQEGNFISAIPVPWRFMVAWAFDAFIMGPLCLWLARIVAHLLYKNRPAEVPASTREQEKMFPKEWSLEQVTEPARDSGFWVLRLLGFAYFAYLLVLIVGTLGAGPWPAQVADLIVMTYKNPALAINTYGKISVMFLLAWLGAYNLRVRWYCTLGLFIGHTMSTVASLAMYFLSAPDMPYRDFLLTSAIVDGVMVAIFIWILLRYKEEARAFATDRDYPAYFSVPARLARWMFSIVAVVSWLMVLIAAACRVFADGTSSLGAVYGFPDPMLANTLTLYTTVGLLAFLLIKREQLRNYLFGVLLFPFFIGLITTVPWFIIGDAIGFVTIETRAGTQVTVDWYFMLFIVGNALVISILIALRKAYYSVDYIINTINPSSARNVMSLVDAFFGGTPEEQADILQSVDKYVGGITGRKRGLLNFPFWLLEHVFNALYGLHPTFSTMSRDERRYFLRKYMLRPPLERQASMIPALAEAAYNIGLAINAISMFANYSQLNNRHEIGYVPADARDRLQGDFAPYPPPFKHIAPLPKDPGDPANAKPATSPAARPQPPLPLIAPRVSTPVEEADIPDEVDYLVIGSGAGGATACYRLACAVKDPSGILMVERGRRYQPLQDFNDFEMDMMRKLYKEGGLQQTKNFTMSVLQGECVGGTTVINNAVCFKLDSGVRNIWTNEYGLDLSGIDAEYEQTAKELDIQLLPHESVNENVAAKFKAGVAGYNSNAAAGEQLQTDYPLSVNYRNALGDGNWNLGNKRQRKRSMLETYIPWSEARGVKVVSNTSAVQFSASNGRKADSVLLRSDTGEYKNVKVRKAIIVAGGVIAGSHFLMRSGVFGNVGQRMSCNFAFPLTFDFDDTIDAFDGTQITLGALDPQNRAVFETYFNPPAAFALASVPFFFARRDSIMQRYRHLINFGTLVGSEARGVIEEKADIINGRAFSWSFGERDRANIRYAFGTLAQLGRYAGARRIVMPTKPGLEFTPTADNVERFIKQMADYPLRMTDLFVGTAHPQGGNCMIGDSSPHKSKRVVNSGYRVEGFDNVYVADASLFPTSMGLNPQWTILALASLAAKKVLADT